MAKQNIFQRIWQRITSIWMPPKLTTEDIAKKLLASLNQRPEPIEEIKKPEIIVPQLKVVRYRGLSLTKLWNNSLILDERELKARDYCWASELGKPQIDRYLSMKGVKQSNPPNERSKRKFFAGNIWEFIAGLVLHQMGIIITKQEHIVNEDMPLKVTGRLDYMIGGTPDYNKARSYIASMPFDQEMMARFLKVIDNFENEYGQDEIRPMVHEIKSCSHYVIEKIQEGGNIEGHDFQIDHYLRGLKMNSGIIDYISRDDALMAERVVTRSEAMDKRLLQDLSTLKGYLDANQEPPKAPLITFENKFSKNFGVEYSSYLTKVYGFETPEDYRNSVQSKIASWNRLLKRLKDINEGKQTPTGKSILLTDKNKLAVDEIAREGFGDANVLSKKAKIEEEEETD